MSRVFRVLWLVFGGLLVLNTIVSVTIIRFNLGLAFTLFVGLVALAYGVFYKPIQRFCDHGWRKALRFVVYVAYAIFIGVTGFVAVYGQIDTVRCDEDALIVPGAGLHGENVSLTLAQRLDAALAYHEQNPDALLVVSGGQGADEVISEAAAMARYLEAHGVDPALIRLEDQSTNTYGNFVYSKALLDAELGAGYSVALATNGFHVYRCMLSAREAGLEPTHLHGQTVWYLAPSLYMREFLGALYCWVFGVR